MSSKWQIHRRTFLRGVGAAMALPMLDAMVPSMRSTARAGATSWTGAGQPLFPKRMAFVYVPNGATMNQWTPGAVGTDFELPRILQPLAAHRSDLSVLTGFAQQNGLPL